MVIYLNVKYVVSYQLGPPDPYFRLFTVCYCTFTKIHTLVGLDSPWIQREIHSFFEWLIWPGWERHFLDVVPHHLVLYFYWGLVFFWWKHPFCQPGRVHPSTETCWRFFHLSTKKASVIQMTHPVNSGGRWATGPTFHFGSTANPSGSVVTGCGFLFTLIPSLCWRHWTREGGSPADMRRVTKLKGEEKKRKKNKMKKRYWFFVRSRGWSRCRVHEWPEKLRQPAEPLPV